MQSGAKVAGRHWSGHVAVRATTCYDVLRRATTLPRTAVLVPIITKLVELLAPTICGKLAPGSRASFDRVWKPTACRSPLSTQNYAYMRKSPKFHQDAIAESLCAL